MMNTQFLSKFEKQEVEKKLKLQFGVCLPEESRLMDSGKEKTRLFMGNIFGEDIGEIQKIAQIEAIGLYLFHKEKDGSLRLSLDATQILGNQIAKNIMEIGDEEAKEWLQGNNLGKQAEKGILVVKHNNDFLGCAKSTGESLLNHIPKDRRIRD